MISTLKKLNASTLCVIFLFNLTMLGFQVLISQPTHTASAQSSGGGLSSYTAIAIGGETEGVADSDDALCCNGVVLEFSAVVQSPFILDGQALMVPFISKGYENGNEYSEGYNTLGKIRPGLCFLPDDYCESFEFIYEIVNVGTSEDEAK